MNSHKNQLEVPASSPAIHLFFAVESGCSSKEEWPDDLVVIFFLSAGEKSPDAD
jgi:hypothetical protein